MKTEEYIALGGLITIISSALALIIKQLESSKCTEINCLCLSCKRKLKIKEIEPEPEPEPQP